ncbi:CoA-transferase family III [Thozetella sp. PMI_491]|nr:CoA-transferase family III [Thozetella sp. PMI_491]
MGSQSEYSVPREAQALFEHGILKNPLMKDLPPELESFSKLISFDGAAEPSIPINWRFAESISAIKAFEATMLNCLIARKYNAKPASVKINTDHASLFFMSVMIANYLKDGKVVPVNYLSDYFQKLFPNQDKHQSQVGLHRILATNIYKTEDGRFYHVHGSMNPEPSLTALKLPLFGEPDDTYDSVVERIQSSVSKIDSATLDELMNEKHRQAGTIAWSSDEYFASEHGQQSGRIGLYEICKEPGSQQAASWWPDHSSLPSSPKRPLAGLKVVDLTRVIAGPAITRSLAEMGASVMRITSPHVTDLSAIHHDFNWGKWNSHLHLKDEADKEKLRRLIREADVVVDGYRPGVMDKLGFGRQDVFNLVKDRPRGIIHVRENCYGWYGPWSHRSGWQQISDACCGVSKSYSQAMGLDEAVTPVFPNSDYCTGAAGSVGVLHALIKRSESGGNYGVDASLNYYSQWLVRSCGTYPDEIWKKVWERHGSPVFRHFHSMQYLIRAMLHLLHEHDAEILFNPSFFESRESKTLGQTFVVVKPIAQFPNNETELKYNVGTRGNGIDQPVWPSDLTVEVVTGAN